MIFPNAPVAHFGKSEDALQNPEWMFHLRSNSRLGRVLSLDFFVYIILESGATAGHILRPGRCLMNRLGLSLIACVAPHLFLRAMQ